MLFHFRLISQNSLFRQGFLKLQQIASNNVAQRRCRSCLYLKMTASACHYQTFFQKKAYEQRYRHRIHHLHLLQKIFLPPQILNQRDWNWSRLLIRQSFAELCRSHKEYKEWCNKQEYLYIHLSLHMKYHILHHLKIYSRK